MRFWLSIRRSLFLDVSPVSTHWLTAWNVEHGACSGLSLFLRVGNIGVRSRMEAFRHYGADACSDLFHRDVHPGLAIVPNSRQVAIVV